MVKTNEHFIKRLGKNLHFEKKMILDIGCGIGARTPQFAGFSGSKVYAIDPIAENIRLAKRQNQRGNITYSKASAEHIPFKRGTFHIVCFTLSLHHVRNRNKALAEAKRVLRHDGAAIVIEPGFHGSMFEAEIRFDCFDGDERREKAEAYATLLSWKGMEEIGEFWDATVWKFESVEEFRKLMYPTKSLGALQRFLRANHFALRAERRINIFRKIQ